MGEHRYRKRQPGERVSFSGFELDLESGELRRGDCIVALRPLATQCLRLLVERAGRLVTNEQIRRELWAGTVVDWSAGIHQAVRQIRQALGDDSHEIIQTVTRHGYRFQLAVQPVSEESSLELSRAASLFKGSRGFAVGFVTPVVLIAALFAWCSSLA